MGSTTARNTAICGTYAYSRRAPGPVDGKSVVCAMMEAYLLFWRSIDGSPRYAGNDLHLCPRPTHFRPEEVAGAGQDIGEGHDRIPPRVKRVEVDVRPGNEQS